MNYLEGNPAAAAEANAKSGLQPLRGQKERVAYAEMVRARMLDELGRTRSNTELVLRDPDKAARHLRVVTDAEWWISHRLWDAQSVLVLMAHSPDNAN